MDSHEFRSQKGSLDWEINQEPSATDGSSSQGMVWISYRGSEQWGRAEQNKTENPGKEETWGSLWGLQHFRQKSRCW